MEDTYNSSRMPALALGIATCYYFSSVESALSAGSLQPCLVDALVLGLFPVYLILSTTPDLGSRILGRPRASWASQQGWGGKSTPHSTLGISHAVCWVVIGQGWRASFPG